MGFPRKRSLGASRPFSPPALQVPPDLRAELDAAASEFAASHAGWTVVTSAEHDEVRGSVFMRLADGSALRMSVSDAEAAGNFAAMVTLAPTRVRFIAVTGSLTVFADNHEWVAGFSGLPALPPPARGASF